MNPGRNKSGSRRNAIVPFAFFAFLFGASLTADRLQSHVSARPTIAASQGQDKASTAAKAQTDAEAAAAEILEKHIAALGGREAYKSIKSVEQEIEQEAFGVVSKVYSIREPQTRRFYQRTEGPNATTETGFDGSRVWQKTSYFRGYLTESDPRAKALSRGERPLIEYRESGKKYVRLPNETIGGKEYLVLATATTDISGREVPAKLYFDPGTYLQSRMVVGDMIKNTTVFDDYRKVDGRFIPFTRTIVNPQATIRNTVKSVRYNIPIDPSRFQFRDDSAKPEESTVAIKTVGNAETSPPVRYGPEDTIPETLRIATFEFAWKKVNDTHWDSSFNGVNWQAVHDKYAPLVKSIQKSDEFHRLLESMMAELGESHFSVMPPHKVAGLSSRSEDIENGAVGLELRWVDKQMLVVDVRKDFPAQASGIRKGFVVTRINGKTSDELLAQLERERPGFQMKEELRRVRAALKETTGKPGTKVSLEVLDNKDNVLKLDLTRKAVPLDTQLSFEHEKLEHNIGYIAFDVFIGDAASKFQEAMRELRDTKALIIDLRGNPGGVGQMGPTMASLLSAGPGSLGALRFRYETQNYSFNGSGSEAYKGRVILLVDEMSASTSEVFGGGLQESRLATVIGSTTAGAVLPSIADPLPTGGALQHPISDFKTPKGVRLEGRGVIPDVIAKPSRTALLAGRDPVLQRAIQFIQDSK